jgi:hypothetical protein
MLLEWASQDQTILKNRSIYKFPELAQTVLKYETTTHLESISATIHGRATSKLPNKNA